MTQTPKGNCTHLRSHPSLKIDKVHKAPPHAKCNTFSFNCSLQNSLQEFPLEPSQDSEATLLNRCLTLLGKKLSLPFLCEFLKYCLYVLIANNRFKVKVLVY